MVDGLFVGLFFFGVGVELGVDFGVEFGLFGSVVEIYGDCFFRLF